MRTRPEAGCAVADGGQVEVGRPVGDVSPAGEELLARVRDLRLYFDTDHGTVKALEGINFDLHTGEIFALVGETGCGKSVTARSFMQLVPTPPGRYPGGEILMRTDRQCPGCSGGGCDRCFGTGREFEDLLAVSPAQMDRIRGDRIAMIFQDPEETMNPSLTIKSHMAEAILAHRTESILEEAGLDPDGLDPVSRWLVRDRASADRSPWLSIVSSVPPLRRHKRRIDRVVERQSLELLGEVQLPNPTATLSSYPHELSGGQLQRVMIAMALGARPDLLIADEATTALDVTTQANILKLVGDLQDEYDTGILYITHDLTLVRDIADRVGVMYAGNMAEIGGIDRVYQNPLHPYTRGLLDSIPSDDRVGTRLEGIGGSIPDLTDPPTGCRFATRCPEVMDHCWDVVPVTTEPEPGHQVDCHLYTDQAPADEG
ncbi:MAG: ABC transporter ATP-binding protein [Halobacteriales archaeon]|nr:ABC transporter ATP-binding protein [Halobacteriales archaeon]